MAHAIWGKDGDDYPFYDKLKFALVARSIRKLLPKKENLTILDVGCGYDARILQQFVSQNINGIGLDFEVSDTMKSKSQYTFYEGDLIQTIQEIPSDSVDFIVFLSILEHMDNPVFLLKEARRILKKDGRTFFCSPTWFGKWVLENVLSNKLLDPYGETPKQYNSHKMYYDPRDFWPLLVKAGFVSTDIKIWRSNFWCSISGYAEKNFNE